MKTLSEECGWELDASATEQSEALLAQAYAEYHRRQDAGEQPDPREWCSRFPSIEKELFRLLYMNNAVGDQLDALHEQQSGTQEILWPLEGEQWDDLTIVRELGRGSFSRVYLATEASTGHRLVVAKFTRLGGSEARTLGRLSHPNVVPLLWARRNPETGLMIVCMPYRGSATLEDIRADLQAARPGSLPEQASQILDVIHACAQPEEALPPPPAAHLHSGTYTDAIIRLAMQLAHTLAFVHRQGVAHCDLKPSNILLDPAGEPLLLDFNLAASTREKALLGGTLRYAPPEQLRAYLENDTETHDKRLDVYALGVIVYEMLAGEHPYASVPPALKDRPLAQFMLERMKTGCRSFRLVRRDLERPVAAVLDRCLAFDVADRPSAAELAAALKHQFAPVRRVRRRLVARPRLSLSLLSLLLVVVGLGAFAWSALPAYSEREYSQGMKDYREGSFDAAEEHFDRACKAGSSQGRYRYARGCARLQRHKQHPDEEKLNQAAEDLIAQEQGTTPASSLAVNAYVHVRKQRPLEAIALYTRILDGGYRPVMALNNRAYCYMTLMRFEEAKKDLDRAAQLDPQCQAVFYNRARLALLVSSRNVNRSPYEQALQDIERAIHLRPTTAVLFYDAALLYAHAADAGLHSQKRQEWLDRAIDNLGLAIASGQPVDLNDKRSLFYRALRSHPAFSTLRNVEPQQQLSARELRLLDPVDLADF